MKKTITLLLAALILMQCTACQTSQTPSADTTEAQTTEEEEKGLATPGTDSLTDEEKGAYQALVTQNGERALAIGQTIEKYYLTGRKDNLTLSEKVNMTTLKGVNTASVWHFTSVVSMTSKLQAINAGGEGAHYAALYPNLVSALDYYKGTGYVTDYTETRKQTMYAVNKSNTKGTADISGIAAVYDDQMWLIREFVYAYKLNGEESYLTAALELVECCLDGWDTTLDSQGKEYGGICWGPGYQTKHTCSNAPIIEPLVEIYEIFTKEGRENAEYYLEWAEKVYKWTTRLNTGNGLYGDLLGSERTTEGTGRNAHYVTTSQSSSIDKTTYTYNTGAMISGAAALYRATGNSSYLRQAKLSAKAAYNELGNHKVKDGYVLYPITSSTTWFNLILLEGFIDLFPYDENCKEYIQSMQASLDYAYENYLTEEGFLPRDYLRGWIKTNSFDSEKNVMDQASAAEMYAILAEFYASITAE